MSNHVLLGFRIPGGERVPLVIRVKPEPEPQGMPQEVAIMVSERGPQP